MAGVKVTGGVRRGSTNVAPTPTEGGGFRPGIPAPQFDRDAFDALFHNNRRDVIWEKSVQCPNRKGPSPADHDINCSLCFGLERVFYDARRVPVATQALTIEESFQAYGRFDTGTIRVTPLSEGTLSFWDRISFCDGAIRFPDMLRRGVEGSIDYLKYDVLCLDHVTWLDRSGALVVAERDVDVVVSGHQLEWLTDNRPDPLTYYSVAYTCRPQFIVMGLPHVDRTFHVITGSGDKPYTFSNEALARLNFFERKESEDPSDENERQDPFGRDLTYRR